VGQFGTYFKKPETKTGASIEFVSFTEQSHIKIRLQETEFPNTKAIAMTH
jgi:hypothetical protein